MGIAIERLRDDGAAAADTHLEAVRERGRVANRRRHLIDPHRGGRLHLECRVHRVAHDDDAVAGSHALRPAARLIHRYDRRRGGAELPHETGGQDRPEVVVRGRAQVERVADRRDHGVGRSDRDAVERADIQQRGIGVACR